MTYYEADECEERHIAQAAAAAEAEANRIKEAEAVAAEAAAAEAAAWASAPPPAMDALHAPVQRGWGQAEWGAWSDGLKGPDLVDRPSVLEYEKVQLVLMHVLPRGSLAALFLLQLFFVD